MLDCGILGQLVRPQQGHGIADNSPSAKMCNLQKDRKTKQN